jgi:glycosyltransferase involved in cell wall biosynthesis
MMQRVTAPATAAAPGVRVALCAPGEIWGGVEQFVESLSRHFVAARVPVLVVTLFDGPLRQRLDAAGVPVHVVGRRGHDPFSVFELARVLRAHRISIVHAHGYKATILGAVAARMAGARLVRTEHGRLEPGRGLAQLKLWLNIALESFVSRRAADAVVYVSRDVQSQSRSAGPRAVQQVIYNGVEPPPAPTRTPLEGFDADPGLFNIGVIGRLVPVKGHAHLLRAVGRLRENANVRLYVFGEGPLERDCRRLVEAEGLDSIVRFMGFRADVQQYLPRLDLLAMPSLHEGLPFTLLEAMYQRVPVVASNVGGLAETIRDGVTGVLVPPADEARLAAAIDRLIADPGLRRRLADSAYALVCEQFLVEGMATRYLEVYQRVAASS